MRMLNGNFLQWMEWLSYLVSTMATNELVMSVARASATIELAVFSWYIPIPATKGVFKVFMAEKDKQYFTSYKSTIWYQYYQMVNLMAYTVNN